MSEPRTWQFGVEPKIVSVYFGSAGSFAYDDSGAFIVVQGFAWIPKHARKQAHTFHPKIALAYLALLNSPIMNDLLSATSAAVQGGQWDLSARYVENIAVPNLSLMIGTSLVDELARLGKSMHDGSPPDDDLLRETVAAAYGIA
jgi:hypothetical protein